MKDAEWLLWPGGPDCDDCPATKSHSRQPSAGGPMLVVVIEHAVTCPWFKAVQAAAGIRTLMLTIPTDHGLLVHATGETTAERLLWWPAGEAKGEPLC